MCKVVDCLDACRRRGETPPDVMGVITEYRDGIAVERFHSPGALHSRLINGTWVGTSSVKSERTQQKAKEQQAKLAASLAYEAQRKANGRNHAEQEAST